MAQEPETRRLADGPMNEEEEREARKMLTKVIVSQYARKQKLIKSLDDANELPLTKAAMNALDDAGDSAGGDDDDDDGNKPLAQYQQRIQPIVNLQKQCIELLSHIEAEADQMCAVAEKKIKARQIDDSMIA